jgi:hypothetical protein
MGRVGLVAEVTVAPAGLVAEVTVAPAALVAEVTVAPAALVAEVTVAPAAPVVLVTMVPVGLAVLVTVGLVAPVVLVTSAVQVALVTSVGPAVPETSVVLVVPTTSDRGLRTRSAGGEVPRGVMGQHRGAGEHRQEPDGAGPFRLPAATGTKGRSTTGATTRTRYGIRAKTAGASTSSESGSRCNQTPAQ